MTPGLRTSEFKTFLAAAGYALGQWIAGNVSAGTSGWIIAAASFGYALSRGLTKTKPVAQAAEPPAPTPSQ